MIVNLSLTIAGATTQSKKEMKTPVSAQLKGIKSLIEEESARSPSLSRSSSKYTGLQYLDYQLTL